MSDTFDHEMDAFESLFSGQGDDPPASWVNRKAQMSDVPAHHGTSWSTNDLNVLRSMFHNLLTVKEMARQLGRTDLAIEMKLSYLGLDLNMRDEAQKFFPSKHYAVLPQTKKERTYVNMNHLITLLQKGYTTCEVSFRDRSTEPTYTYKVSTKLGLKVDDQVVVYGKDNMQIAFVRTVHDEPQIDVKAPYAIKWIVCRVERADYDDQVKRETEAVKMLEQAERKQAQEQALEALLGNVNREELMKLINGPQA